MGNNISSRTKGTQPNLSPIQRQLIEVLLSSVDPCLKDALWAVLKNTDGREAIQYLASLLANQNQNQNQNQPLTPEDHKRMQRNKAKALAIRTENLKRRHFVRHLEENRRLYKESTSSSTNANTHTPPPPAVNTGAGGQYALGFTPQPSPSQHVQNLKDPPEKKAMKQTTIPATRPFAVTPTKRATPAKNPYITRSQPKAKRREEMNDFALAKAIEEEEDVAAVNILENFEAAQALQSLYATATNVHVVQEHQARGSVHTHQLINVETVEADSDDDQDDEEKDAPPLKSAWDGDYGEGFDENGYAV